MNWSRTKEILIVAFLIVNIFLGYQLWEKQTRKLELANIADSTIEERLALRDVELSTELPAEQPELSQINAQFLVHAFEDLQKYENQQVYVNEHLLQSSFNQKLSLEQIDSLDMFFSEIVIPHVAQAEDYELEQYIEGEQVSYIQYYHDHPVFISRLDFYLEDMYVTGYEQTYYHIVSTGTPQRVLSAATSLRTLLDQQTIPAQSTITDVRLGYYGHIYAIDSQVLIPTWRFVIEGEGYTRYIYVNALTGVIEVEETQ